MNTINKLKQINQVIKYIIYNQLYFLFNMQQNSQRVNVAKQVPLLPGHIFNDPYRQNFHKTQQFNLVNGTQLQKKNYIAEDEDQNLLDNMTNGKFTLDLTYGNRQKPSNDYVPRIQPPWIKFDRQVLRFYAYFQQHVVENALENYRLRKVTIYYYLMDETILVLQPRVENSGIPQGVFIRRKKLPKTTGELSNNYTWKDFNVATNIVFFDRVFRIYDCDQFTREFYQYVGQPLNASEEELHDSFDNFIEKKQLKINPPDTKEYKQYIEVKLGGGHPNDGLARYIANDRKVLSFNGFWEDNTLEGGVNYFTINYFLADDSVEVKEVRNQNSGRDPFPHLLRRQKLPKVPINTHYPGFTLKKEEFYTPKDLIIGKTIQIYGREVVLYDCDDFTKQYYQDNFQILQTPLQLKKSVSGQIIHPIPVYNGYGTLEDSLGNVYSLQPKPPKKDIIKMFTSDQNILRFEARLISKTKDYNSRKFILNYFCGDDTVQVYQDAEKNSGVWGGKFLERKKYRNQTQNRYLNQRDFQIGSIVKLGAYSFQLLRVDEFTAKYMHQRPSEFPEGNISIVIDKIKKQFAPKHKSYDQFLIWFIKTVDPSNRGILSYEEFFNNLTGQLPLQDQQVYTIFRNCYLDKTETQLSMRNLWRLLGGA